MRRFRNPYNASDLGFVPPKDTASGAAREEFTQLRSLNRLSPYLSLYSLTTAKHMALQPQRPAIVMLSVLSFPAGFSCLVRLGRHIAACRPPGGTESR